MTAMRIMKNRSTVMPSSRTRMMTGTHHGSSPTIASPMSAAAMSDLSAMGSAILPKFVTRLYLRARSPSILSVSIASRNTASAHHRVVMFCPPSLSSNTRKTGTSRIRTTVRALGMFQLLGAAWGGVSARSFTPQPYRRPLTTRRSRPPVVGDRLRNRYAGRLATARGLSGR